MNREVLLERADRFRELADSLRDEAVSLGRLVTKTQTATPDLVGVAEWADACRTTGSTVSNWVRRGRMPEPFAVLACGPIWTREQLEAWADENGQKLKSTTSRRNGTRRKSR